MSLAEASAMPDARSCLLELEGVTLQYRTERHIITATHRVSFSVGLSERLILLGPSGCGKSTLLKAIAGFIKPVEGEIRIHGARMESCSRDRVMVFQEFDQLLPWKTVLENVMFPLLVARRMGKSQARERALDVIRKVNLAAFVDAHPHMLSGGMKQRTAIARALAMEPEILLMDEPFASLDALTRQKMQEELLHLWQHMKCTLLFVTHSVEEAMVLASRVLVLSPHPGQVEADIRVREPNDVNTGKDSLRHVAGRINAMLLGFGRGRGAATPANPLADPA